MISVLIQKELRSIMVSPKFSATFAVCSLLILLSVYVGIQEYQTSVERYETATNLADQKMRERTNWMHLGDKTFRSPDPLQIFASGLTYDIGRWTEISSESTVKLRNSTFSDDPIFAVFRLVDFMFIVHVVLSLFAILFTYDAISGEREDGTLKLVFSNSVSRAQYLIGKCIGSWLGLVLPICIPILLGILMVMLYQIPMTGDHWFRLAGLIGLSLALFTFFIFLGVFISSLTRNPNVSFLISLVVWVGLVLIIPRAGAMAAGQIVSVPRVAEMEGRRDAYAADQWVTFNDEAVERWSELERDENTTEEQRDQDMWARMQEEDSLRGVVMTRIESYETTLLEDLRNRKREQETLAFILSRFSPASAYQLGAMALAGTDIDLKRRYEEALSRYRTEFNDYVGKKVGQQGQGHGGIEINISTETGVQIKTPEDKAAIDVSDRPRFQAPKIGQGQSMAGVVVDFGLISLSILLAFLGSFVAFIRYDVR